MKRKYVYYSVPVLFFFVISLFFISMILSQNSVQDIATLFSRGDSIETMMTFTNRTTLWHTIFSEVTPKIALVGYGYSVITKDFGVDFGTGILYGAHNAYFSVFLGTGIFSLIAFVAFLLSRIHDYWKVKADHNFGSFVVLGSLIHFSISCLMAEEIGVNTTITFSYLVFLTTIFDIKILRKES